MQFGPWNSLENQHCLFRNYVPQELTEKSTYGFDVKGLYLEDKTFQIIKSMRQNSADLEVYVVCVWASIFRLISLE